MNLHLAASRFERLEESILKLICTPEWVHLGEPPLDRKKEIIEEWKSGYYKGALKQAAAWLYRRWRPKTPPDRLKAYYENTEFREFYFEAGDRLDFADGYFAFIFAEHFFEHLWLHETQALLKELMRIMEPGGVLRISVPDADLRTYEGPESPAFPPGASWTHHQKHKMRWNVYSLTTVLENAGFRAEPVMFCDKHGKFHDNVKALDNTGVIEPAVGWRGKMDYLRRLPSLIVDGIKPKEPEAGQSAKTEEKA